MKEPEQEGAGGGHSPTVVLPVYNDWEACALVIEHLDGVLSQAGVTARVMVVNDGSTLAPPAPVDWLPGSFEAVQRVDRLDLVRNVGHQRAICLALCSLAVEGGSGPVVIMDADGEDDPRDVPRLLQTWEEERGKKVVFAERRRRSESAVFRVSYWLYRTIHRILTGIPVRVGNFSVISRTHLRGLTTFPELWSHYAAAVFVSSIPFSTLPTDRAKRLVGESRMNYVRLVAHGLSAIAVFSEAVGVRVLLGSLGLIFLTVLGLAAVTAMQVLTLWAIPSWAPLAGAILGSVVLVAIMFAFLFTFVILADRKTAPVIPIRDHLHFIGGLRQQYPARVEADPRP